MFRFTPLLGAQCASPASQSLLELDGGVKILVDLGWDESFNADNLKTLEQHVSTLSVILLTHPTIEHLGAFVHCCKHIPLFCKIPVYETTPVINLGRALLTDLYASNPLASSIISDLNTSSTASSSSSSSSNSPPNFLLEPPSTEDITGFFALINPLKYSQPHQPIPSPFSPPLGGLTITAYGAGHSLGGTIWHIQHGLESIVYATDWNQGKENLFPGAAWLGSAAGAAEIIEPLRRPTALVCSTRGVQKSNPLPRKKRDETLISLIRETVSQGGKVLVPTDSAARVLEIAFLLNSTWRENMDGPHADIYKKTKIYMAGRSSNAAIRNVRSMLEWIDDSVRVEAEAFETVNGRKDGTESPLDWKFIRPIERQSQIDRVLSRTSPCVILASDATLEWGFSNHILHKISSEARNLVILTERICPVVSSGHSLGVQLWDICKSDHGNVSSQSGAKVVSCNGQTLQYRQVVTSSLTSEEDAQYQNYTARQRQKQNAIQGTTVDDTATTEIAEEQLSDSEDSDDEDEDPEHQGRAMNLSTQLNQSGKRQDGLPDVELGINVLLRSSNVHDYDVRHRRGRERIFPFAARRDKHDDFGDVIKPQDYLRAEERDDVEGIDMRENTMQESAVGHKRRWDDAGSRNVKKRSKTQNIGNSDDIDAAIARATGEVDLDEKESNTSDESDYEPDMSPTQGPRKAIFMSASLIVHSKIAHVDYAGLHEKRDLQMLIPLIRPRNLILIAGQAEETQYLSRELRELLRTDDAPDISTPLLGEVVDASVDTNAWSLKLSQRLVKNLAWQNVKGLGVVALTGRLELEREVDMPSNEDDGERTTSKKAKVAADGENSVQKPPKMEIAAVPVLEIFAAQQQQQQYHLSQPVHVGDLRLASLRQLVTASGHTAEFRGEGTLLIDGTVVVRKGSSGRIEIEAGAGGLSMPQYRTREAEGSFYAVRRLIYEGLAVVAGA